MYNQPISGGYDGRGDMRSGGYYEGSRSMYNGYDGGSDYMRNGPADMRRSRSTIHDQRHAQLPQRRNPYDYLPDEPHHGMQTSLPPTGASSTMGGRIGPNSMAGGPNNPTMGNKPDIMQSVDMDGTVTGNRYVSLFYYMWHCGSKCNIQFCALMYASF